MKRPKVATLQGDPIAVAKVRAEQDARPKPHELAGPEARQPGETEDQWFDRWLRDYWRG